MTVIKVHRLAVADTNCAELEQRFYAARHMADRFLGFEGFELWRPAEDGADYFVVTRWKDEASYRGYADARQSRDPNTVVSRPDGVLSFEKVDLSER